LSAATLTPDTQLKKLEQQKEGKKRLKRIGTVDVPQEAFFELLGSTSRDK